MGENKKEEGRDKMEVDTIRMEEGAEELLESPDAQPYLQLAVAVSAKRDPKPALEEISRLPLEKRYLWRIVSALKWAFVDLDTFNIAVDRRTLPREDLSKVVDLVRVRPVQFCLFLKAFLGAENMERIMTEAIEQAKRAPEAGL